MKNDEFHASFLIRQHTPIIHFQADQPGALLRISELKPAFDRYLWQTIFKVGLQADQHKAVFDQKKTLLVGYSPKNEEGLWREFEQENWALDYRVSIDYNQTDLRQWDIPAKFPCFFGDMGEQQPSISRKFVQISSDFTITFVCFHPELTEVIRTWFPDFLRTKNFGLRQSKGFGSFTVQKDASVVPGRAHNAYCFRVNTTRPDDLFKHIELFWRVVRTGYNRPDRQRNTVVYIKCPLFFYLRDQWHHDIASAKVPDTFKTRMAGKSVQWDKRSIKQAYFSTELINQQNRRGADILGGFPAQSDNGRYFLMRDLFGLASESQWMSYRATIKKNHKPQQGQETIDRFKSPVTFKPVRNGNGYDVYVCVKPIPTEFGNQAFTIQRDRDSRLILETPPPGSFRITKYFDFIHQQIAEKLVDADPDIVTLNDERDQDWLKIVNAFSTFDRL